MHVVINVYSSEWRVAQKLTAVLELHLVSETPPLPRDKINNRSSRLASRFAPSPKWWRARVLGRSWRHKMTARGMLIRQRWKNPKHFISSDCLSLSLNSNFFPLSPSSVPLFLTCRVVFRSSFSYFSVLVVPPVAAVVPLGSLHHVGTSQS